MHITKIIKPILPIGNIFFCFSVRYTLPSNYFNDLNFAPLPPYFASHVILCKVWPTPPAKSLFLQLNFGPNYK